MKKILLSFAAVILAATSFAQNWKIDPAHSKLGFSTSYLVITDVSGEFKKIDGNITASNADWSDLQATITADVNSITTENEMRDKHIKSDDFFNAEKFPAITFKSKSVKKLGDKKFILTGDLTIRDVTKTVEVPVVFNGIVKDPWGNTKAGFKATGKINRKEFNLKYSNAAATGEAVVGDEVEFTVDLTLIKASL
jgi:polyisoprenoid-binding protein YceI